MALSDEQIQDMKSLMEKKSGKEISWEEAADGARHLADFAKLMFDFWIQDQRRLKRLEEFPKGYSLDGIGYNCFICGGSTPKDGNWYDKWGIKCLVCQKAIDRKEIPPSLAKFKDGWYSRWELQHSFNLTAPILKRWVKDGIIKVRTVTGEGGRTHTQLFLLRDNKDFLPPKEMVKSRIVSEERDGQTWHRSYPWYRFVDPFAYLKEYKIMDYMQRKEESGAVKKT